MAYRLTKQESNALRQYYTENRGRFSTNIDCAKEAVKELGISIPVNSALVNRHCKPVVGQDGVSPYDTIKSAEKVILSAIKDLEKERNDLHNRMIAIDTTIAKYKKLTM